MHQKNIEERVPDLYRLRSDSASASLIEHALVVQSCHGTYYAARLLHSKGIGLVTALRLLTRPDRQRRATQPALLAPRLYGSVPSTMYRHTWA
jgi:hypothetical protein